MMMSLQGKATNGDQSVHSKCLSSNHKVMHYLQNSTSCSKAKAAILLQNGSEHSNDLFNSRETPTSTLSAEKDRSRSCSDNNSSPSVIESLSRSDFSLGSSLSDRGGYYSNLSSNTSSSGVCSTFSDVGQEETRSDSSEELDFNIGFEQNSDHDGEIANLNEIDDLDSDDYDQHDDENQTNSNKNSADTATLRDITESNLDVRISELEEFLRKSYDSNDIYNCENHDFDHDDTITSDRNSYRARAPFLHDSNYSLSSQDRFTAYEDDDQENDQLTSGLPVRSNSLRIIPLNTNSALLDKAPKKVVRFADVLGLDLESIRYMTPPDQSTTSLIQECIRIKLEQLRLAKNYSSSPSNMNEFSGLPNRCSSPLARNVRQYCLISKYFTSATNNIRFVHERHIMLECLYTKDAVAYGTARVHNIAYDKRVFVRVTENDWQTFYDVQAWHSMNFANDNTDTFTFEIRLRKYNDPSKVPKEIYFAVCLQTIGQEYWDNNQGWNYTLTVLERS